MNKLVDIFCDIDDFCYQFLSQWEKYLVEASERKRKRQSVSNVY